MTANIKDVISVESDPILSKKISQEDFERRLSELPNDQQIINFYFFYTDSNSDIMGIYIAEQRANSTSDKNIYNNVFIGYNADESYADDVIPPIVARTIRHELQHFTQDFYSFLLGSKRWIGLPTKKSVDKNKNLHGDSGDNHWDIPLELSTVVQDEIEYFIHEVVLPTNSFKNPHILRLQIFNFIGIEKTPRFTYSRVFKRYLKTNKELWRWSVQKLLSAIEKENG